jgi:hypothetical protein
MRVQAVLEMLTAAEKFSAGKRQADTGFGGVPRKGAPHISWFWISRPSLGR